MFNDDHFLNRVCATYCSISAPYVGMSFCNECVVHVFGVANSQDTRTTQNEIKIQPHDSHSENTTLWWAVHADALVVSYSFSSRTVRGVDYYQMLESYVRSEAQRFPQNSNFSRTEIVIKLNALYVSFWETCFRNYWLKDTVQQVQQQDHLT